MIGIPLTRITQFNKVNTSVDILSQFAFYVVTFSVCKEHHFSRAYCELSHSLCSHSPFKCVYVPMRVIMCNFFGCNDVEKPQSEAANSVWNGQSSGSSLLGMTNVAPAACCLPGHVQECEPAGYRGSPFLLSSNQITLFLFIRQRWEGSVIL